jgi:CheY-like chemotaxis protein
VECPAIGASVVEQLRKFAFAGDRHAANLQIAAEHMPYGSVLVVDDVYTNLYVAEGLLGLYHLKIETADSGFAAIRKAENGGVYDIIFMDHMMPHMDGIETTRKMRDMGYKGAIVALTANAIVGNDAMFMQNGFDGFISKPIDVRQLNEILSKFVRDKHPEEAKKYAEETTEQGETGQCQNIDRQNQDQHFGSVLTSHKSINPAVNPRLLKFFCKDASQAIVTLRKTVESGDAKLFTITVHAMKSALANVGEAEASHLAAALENVGRSGDMGYISENIDEFIQTLESLIDKFSAEEGAETDSAGNEGASDAAEDKDYLKEQLLIIKSACADYDDDAAYAALDRLKESRWKPATANSLKEIRDALFVSSDFEGAAEQCGALMGLSAAPVESAG